MSQCLTCAELGIHQTEPNRMISAVVRKALKRGCPSSMQQDCLMPELADAIKHFFYCFPEAFKTE